MSYFFDKIMNESYAYGGNNNLSSSDMYEIDSRITADPISMYDYTSECLNNIYRIDAAYAKFESMNIVAALEAKSVGDSYRLQQVAVAMEGAVGDAVEKIKEWIRKAFNAVKNFLKKCWTKLKSRIDIIRGQVGKYEDILKNRNLSGCQVEWVKYNPDDVYKEWDRLDKIINESSDVANDIRRASDLSQFKKPVTVIMGDDNFKEANLEKTIKTAGLVDKNKYNDQKKAVEPEKVEFDSVKNEIFGIVGKDPVAEYNKLSLGGENALSAASKTLDEKIKELQKAQDKEKDSDEYKNTKDDEREKYDLALKVSKDFATFRVTIYRRFAARLNEVLNARTAQAVAACKKAITFAHEKGREQKEEKETKENYSFNVQSFNDMLNYV